MSCVRAVRVCVRVPAGASSQVLFIEKTRVGTQVAQSEVLNYLMQDGTKKQRASIPAGSQCLIPDDFTNSGSTLFGGATIVRRHIQGDATVAAFVSHFVAKCTPRRRVDRMRVWGYPALAPPAVA